MIPGSRFYAHSEAELCVCDVAALIGSSNATASYHLRLLNHMGLAKYRRKGKWSITRWWIPRSKMLEAWSMERARRSIKDLITGTLPQRWLGSVGLRRPLPKLKTVAAKHYASDTMEQRVTGRSWLLLSGGDFAQ